MTGSTTKVLTQLQAKIHYLDIISGLPSYGAKCFSTNQRDGVERVLLVSPRFGLSQIIGIRSSVPQPICTIEELSKVSVTKIDEVSDAVAVYIAPDRLITFPMEDREASEFVIVLGGYYRLLTGKFLSVDQEREIQIEDIPPPYLSQHTIIPASWSYFPYPTEKQTYSMAFLMPPPYHSTKQILTSMKSNELCDRNMNSTIAANQNHISTLERLNNKYASDMKRNDDVLRRVVEMQKMVENSEQYLNEHGDFTTTCSEYELRPNIHDPWRETSVDFESDCDSISSSKQSYNIDSSIPAAGVLIHSDSLTLLSDSINLELNDIERDLNTVLSPLYDNNRATTPQLALPLNNHDTPKTERKVQGFSKIISDLQALGHDLSLSESDSESVYSPNSSPVHQNQVRQNNQRNRLNRHSFGLHSPDNNVFPVEQESTKLREYLAKLRENSSKENERNQELLGFNLADDSLIVNDPDLIDLTSIPPPQTPDELDALSTLPVPPRGFDDKQKQTNIDLEAFIKQVTVVPPTQKATPAVELTPEEILSFIIPPPPDLNDTITDRNSTSDEHMYCNKSEVLLMSHKNTFSHNHISCTETTTMMNEFLDTQTKNNLDCKLNGNSKQGNGNIIEYPSLDRKPFLCCGKSEKQKNAKNEEQSDATENGFLKPPPRRCMHSELDPIPQRPPKNIDLHRRTKSPSPCPVQTTHLNGFSDYNDAVPPSLPPRETTPMSPPLFSLPPKKPPLPHKPFIKSPIPVIKNNVERSTPVRTATIGSPHLHKPASTYHDIERAFNFSKEDIEQTNTRCNGHIRSRSDCPPNFPNAKLVNGVSSTQQPVSMLFSPQLNRKQVKQQFSTPPLSPFLSNRNGSIVNVEGLLAKTDFAMAGLQVKLDQIANACTQAQHAGGGVDIDEHKFQSARDELTEQALHLVTSSKQLVVAMSDPHLNSLPEHLTACLTAIRRITELGQVLTLHTSSPLQTRNIILKIHDVASGFRELACVKVGTTALPGELALHAECLANVLATLLRSLRLFSP